jgi:hypothetical protein
MDANVFIVPCPSPLPWEHGRSRDTLSGGNFLQAPTSGEQDRREGVPDSHSLKAARTDSFLPGD